MLGRRAQLFDGAAARGARGAVLRGRRATAAGAPGGRPVKKLRPEQLAELAEKLRPEHPEVSPM